jgi:hypothetical protein
MILESSAFLSYCTMHEGKYIYERATNAVCAVICEAILKRDGMYLTGISVMLHRSCNLIQQHAKYLGR